MEAIAKRMKEKGLRFTSQKKEVLDALLHKPQTVIEILDCVKSKNKSVDKATIYRILTGFIDLKLVKKINFNGREAHYELINENHHHHLVCNTCGAIEDVSVV